MKIIQISINKIFFHLKIIQAQKFAIKKLTGFFYKKNIKLKNERNRTHSSWSMR